jgi:hypothetical protein
MNRGGRWGFDTEAALRARWHARILQLYVCQPCSDQQSTQESAIAMDLADHRVASIDARFEWANEGGDAYGLTRRHQSGKWFAISPFCAVLHRAFSDEFRQLLLLAVRSWNGTRHKHQSHLRKFGQELQAPPDVVLHHGPEFTLVRLCILEHGRGWPGRDVQMRG